MSERPDLGDYEHQLRVLVMKVVMDDLSLKQIDKYFFVYKPPERLKDHGRERLRSELLDFIDEQLLDEWRKAPHALQEVLQTLGRPDLSTKVQELVERYQQPAATVCQETGGSSPQQESAGAGGRQPPPPPVQETQLSSSQIPLRRSSAAQDELDRDCADREDMSLTGGEAQREAQPQALPNHSTLQSSRYNATRKSLKQRRERRDPLEKIQEEMSPLLDHGDKCNPGEGILKRTPSTASTISHDSSRSSGYYSNPRTSYLRLSTADSIAENDYYDQEAEDGASKLKQTRRDSVEDEGVVTDHSSKLRAESPESSGTESSSPPSSPSKSDGTTTLAAAEEQDNLQPILRRRCNQMTPTHKRRQLPKQTNVLYDDFLPEIDGMRRRSSSLPTTTRARCVKAQQNSTMNMHSATGPHSQSHSSSTSLDSETTYGSPSEQGSMDGSQLSIASAASGHDSKSNSLSRQMSPLNQIKPLPVDSAITVMGSMKIKLKEVQKSIDKNSRNAIPSGEFPSFRSHRGPRYEMRFVPSTFSKEKCSALYIDVAKSYINKKSKRKEQQHRMIEIPAMSITVQLSYDGVEGSFIKTGVLETDVKKINSCGDASERTPVASFPKLVSHSELGLSEALAEGRSSLVIHVNMNVRSS